MKNEDSARLTLVSSATTEMKNDAKPVISSNSTVTLNTTRASPYLKKVNVYDSRDSSFVTVPVSGTFSEFLGLCEEKLGKSVTCLQSMSGAVIESVTCLREDEVLRASGDSDSLKIESNGMFGGDLDWVHLNVGGKTITTTRTTLLRDPDSMLATMFSNTNWKNSADDNGAFLLDRCPEYFEPLLNFLRHGRMILNKNVNPEGVYEEARFFGVRAAMECLEPKLKGWRDNAPITRKQMVKVLMMNPDSKLMRCQGMNFEGANLALLDLRNINFNQANMKNCNLRGCNLSNASFVSANLSHSILDGAECFGVNMTSANFEHASLRQCNFEDSKNGSIAVFQGARLKSAKLDDSNLGGANLRIACLRDSSLLKCSLRKANLAGADLENCNLRGCDLNMANLRGANMNQAMIDDLPHALHMSALC